MSSGGGPAATTTRVGKYQLGKTLGEGSFAKVKYAKHVDTGDCVAIKVLDKEQVLKHKMVEQVLVFGFSLVWGIVETLFVWFKEASSVVTACVS